MRSLRSLCQGAVIAFMISALVGPVANAGPKSEPEGPKGPPQKVFVRDVGQAFCPSGALIYGNIIIPGRQCYTLSVLRDTRGTFLAFVPPGERIPPGQLVRLTTPAGAKLRGRLFLVPIHTSAVLVPVNTVTLVATRIEDYGPQTAIVLVGTPAPNLTVIFSVRL